MTYEGVHHVVFSNELPNCQRDRTCCQCAQEPPEACWNWPRLALGLGKRSPGDCAPAAIRDAENEQRLRKPQGAIDEMPVLPERDKRRPESVASRECY